VTIAIDLISKGYLPEELPPPFTSASLGAFATSTGLSVVNTTFASAGSTHLLRHNLARAGGLRRALAVPNPVQYLRLAEAIEAGWSNDFQRLWVANTIASSRPTHPSATRAFGALAPSTSERRIASRSAARVLLKADVQNFYPSVYSHSLPWALHTKAVAKAQRQNMTLIGNRIDKAVRDSQDGQTMGLPIGPDASWVLAEAIMAVVERSVVAKIGGIRGHRFIDDFELSFRSLAQAEEGLVALQESLAEFELSLNPRKTRIVDLPEAIEDPGIAELRQWTFRATPAAQRTDLIAYFDRLATLIHEQPGSHLPAYAVARLRSAILHPMAWPLLESLLLNLLVAEPSCARHVAVTISSLTAMGHSVDSAALSQVMEEVALKHARLGHGSEVSWALWLCIANRVAISQTAAAAVGEMEDDIVALLALHANQLGLVVGGLPTAKWAQLMTSDELRGPHWLLSYEARVKNWLPSFQSADHVAPDPFFARIRAAQVSFYDLQATIPVTSTSAGSRSGDPTLTAIGGGYWTAGA
jgi:hypothetical protein